MRTAIREESELPTELARLLGFVPADDPKATHVLVLRAR
jgi:hypothetical protein